MCKSCSSKFHKENPNYDSRYKKYNITEKEYQELLEKQYYKCAICGMKMNGKRLYVDHDHKTGKVRGLLCQNCNHGLGNFRDNTEIMTNAIDYLKRNQ